MAKVAVNAVVGSLVYEAFKPNKPAKVISIRPSTGNHPNDSYYDYLTVKFEDSSIVEFPRSHLNDFEVLIEDHKRKYLKFDAVAQKLRLL